MADNRGVAYLGPGKVEVQNIPYPKLVNPNKKGKAEHGVILKVVTTNICGSDQHMVRGRTTAPTGLILGHEITGEVVEKGRDVEFLRPCNLCPHMKRITLDKILRSLQTMTHEVKVDPAIAVRAKAAVDRMLAVGKPKSAVH